ncbi:MAG: DUF3775 domain-containing protein [Rhodomicrobium sp.]
MTIKFSKQNPRYQYKNDPTSGVNTLSPETTEAGLEEAYGDEALTISPEKICFVIVRARKFDVKDANSEQESGSNPADDNMLEVLEDTSGDPVYQELRSFISDLTEDEQIDLVALAWLGRDGYTHSDWLQVRAEALQAHRSQKQLTADYLLGIPLLGDYLEESLSLFGRSCEEFEIGRL